MRQRALHRTTEPNTPSFRTTPQKYKPKPCFQGTKKAFRNYCKRFYKAKKKEDREIGLQINSLIQELHYEQKKLKESPPKTDKERKDSAEYIVRTLNEITELRKVGRIQNDLPSFAAFFRYIRKQKISLSDLKEMEKEEE